MLFGIVHEEFRVLLELLQNSKEPVSRRAWHAKERPRGTYFESFVVRHPAFDRHGDSLLNLAVIDDLAHEFESLWQCVLDAGGGNCANRDEVVDKLRNGAVEHVHGRNSLLAD